MVKMVEMRHGVTFVNMNFICVTYIMTLDLVELIRNTCTIST